MVSCQLLTGRWLHAAQEGQWDRARLLSGWSVSGEPGPTEPVLDNAEGAADPTTEAPLIPKGGIFAELSFEEPRGSGAVWSHHTVHAPRASIARVTVRDEGPESAHLGLLG